MKSACVRATACLIVVLGPSLAGAASDPAALFARKCSSCHAYGKGDRVGPDLKDVTARRSRAWLTSWIQSSERRIAAGDPTAIALFKKYKQERMPDQNLSLEEIGALLDFLAAGGPESADRSQRHHASTATDADVAHGRALFFGAVTPKSGGASCASCHTAGVPGGSSWGATFGGDLTQVYSRFQDAALSVFLKRPCFPRAFPAADAAPLTDSEAFAVKAFLRHVDLAATSVRGTRNPR